MRTVVVIQARLGSTRLPGKVMMDICGKPMLQHVVERVQTIRGVDDVVVAMPHDDVDALAWVHGVWSNLSTYPFTTKNIVFPDCGDSDVLSRFSIVAEAFPADVYLRITADCPLIDPELCNHVRCLVPMSASYATLDTRRSGFPDGLDCEAFTMGTLMMAYARATDPYDREHVTTWVQRSYSVPGTTPYPVLCREQDKLSKVKLSVDTQEDLDRVRRIMARIPAGDYSWKATAEAIREERII
jgi:spore coat polysaccharide biosynthesis protein SpsF